MLSIICDCCGKAAGIAGGAEVVSLHLKTVVGNSAFPGGCEDMKCHCCNHCLPSLQGMVGEVRGRLQEFWTALREHEGKYQVEHQP